MRTTKHSIVPYGFLFLIILFAQTNRAIGGAGARRMSCVVRVQVDSAVMPMDFKTVAALLRSDAVAGRAAIDVFEMKSDGGRDLYQIEPLASGDADVVQLALDVQLPDGVKTAAREFGDALIENLRVELGKFFDVQVKKLQERLKRGQDDVERAQKQFRAALQKGVPDKGDIINLRPDDAEACRLLEQMVDLSLLKSETPLGEAVKMLSRSVEPPLKIVVFWKDLLDNAQIKPATPIGMDGPAAIQLEAGLKTVLNAVAGGFTQLDYIVEHGVVTVATVDSLPPLQMEACVHRVPALIKAMGQTKPLVGMIMEAVEPESWFDMADYGEGTIQPIGDGDLLVRQSRVVHLKIQQALQQIASGFPVALPTDVSRDVLDGQMGLLQSYRDELQAELDGLQNDLAERERARANLAKQHNKNSWDSVHMNLQEIVNELETLKRKVSAVVLDPPSAYDVDAIIHKVKACIERSKDHPPALRPYTVHDMGSPWHPSSEVAALMKRLSFHQAALEAVTDRIAQVDRMLIGPRVFDPEVERIRRAAGRLQEATVRVEDLAQRLANPRAPLVTPLGRND